MANEKRTANVITDFCLKFFMALTFSECAKSLRQAAVPIGDASIPTPVFPSMITLFAVSLAKAGKRNPDVAVEGPS